MGTKPIRHGNRFNCIGNAIIVGVIRCNHFRNRDLYLLSLVDEYEKRVFALA